MKRIVGLAAFCYMVLGIGNTSYVEAAKSFNQLRSEELEKNSKVQEYLEMKEDPKVQEYLEIRKDPEIQEYLKLQKKNSANRKRKRNEESASETERENFSARSRERNEEFASETESDGYVSQTTKKKKKSKSKSKRNRSVQNFEDDSTMYNDSDNQTINGNQNNNQTTSNKKKKRKKKNKKNRSNQMNQMGQANQTNMMYQNQTNQMNQMGQMNMINQNQTNQMNRMGQSNQTNMMYQNQANQMGQSGQTNSKKRKKKNKKNRSNQMNQMNQIGQMGNSNSGDVFSLNEPIIDSTKIKKSSIIVEKDIKLASNKETKKSEKAEKTVINSINLSPLDKKEVLAHVDSEKNVKLAANSDNHDLKIKEKLRQANNDRKTYNLIRTPDKTLKDNIRVNKFRAELDHYRKLYSANSKTA